MLNAKSTERRGGGGPLLPAGGKFTSRPCSRAFLDGEDGDPSAVIAVFREDRDGKLNGKDTRKIRGPLPPSPLLDFSFIEKRRARLMDGREGEGRRIPVDSLLP